MTVTVSDNFGSGDTETFAVDVLAVPPPPVVLGIQLNGLSRLSPRRVDQIRKDALILGNKTKAIKVKLTMSA